MDAPKKFINILMADDDEEDCLFAKKAFQQSPIKNNIIFVHDGDELLDYLNNRGVYKDEKTIHPDLILLDLNMPRKDGREALAEIKGNPALRSIPVIILTTSKQEEDVQKTYALGASSFICKPVDFAAMTKAVNILTDYWFGVVKLPK